MTPEERASVLIIEKRVMDADRDELEDAVHAAICRAIREAIEQEREEIAQFIETHTVAYNEAKVVKGNIGPAASQIALATAIRSRGGQE